MRRAVTLCSIAILLGIAVVGYLHIAVQFYNHHLIYMYCYSADEAATGGHLVGSNITVKPLSLLTPKGNLSFGGSWIEGGALRVSPLFFVRTPWSHHLVPNKRYHLCFSVLDAPAGLDYMFRFRNMRYGSPLIQPHSVHKFDVSEDIQMEYDGCLMDRGDNVLTNSDFTIRIPADVRNRIKGEANHVPEDTARKLADPQH